LVSSDSEAPIQNLLFAVILEMHWGNGLQIPWLCIHGENPQDLQLLFGGDSSHIYGIQKARSVASCS
jgi:hypothetical protein